MGVGGVSISKSSEWHLITEGMILLMSGWNDINKMRESGIKKKSQYYSKNEEVILTKTTKSINYDYGYDSDIDLDYIYSFKLISCSRGFFKFKPVRK